MQTNIQLLFMVYPQSFEAKIGFDSVRTMLDELSTSTLGREKVSEMSFSNNIDTIQRNLCQTNEMLTLIQENDVFPLDLYADIRPYLSRIRVEGTFLQENELFDLYRSLLTMQQIVHFIHQQDIDRFPELHILAKDVKLFPEICRQIESILSKFGKIKDNASSELAHIRKTKLQVSSSISRIIQSIIRKGQSEGYIEKDITPSLREGRLVIPVSPAYKRKINGIFHDESASGKTIYIEPAEVVDANNQIRELESQEKREITKILISCSNFIRGYLQALSTSYDFLGLIDFIHAKAEFAKTINGILPDVYTQSLVLWHDTIHPLLYLTLKKQGKTCVPLSIQLTPEERLLVISGPNAGGKSVCLKTVGLIQYMMQCGMLVPMKENSKMGIFDAIFIDIGDEQSIDNDLSTYSSHLTNMKFFAKNCSEKSLLLIDEFGSGTEPLIGGAIAEATLNVFHQKGAFGVVTTHYTNLKHYASETDGIVNGAMLYDRHLLQPLFQLEIGNPGSSFAIEIARKIGLPETIINTATEKLGAEHIDYDKHLQDIARDKRYWENKRQQIRLKEKKLEENIENLRSELESINKQRKLLLKEAKNEAIEIIHNANSMVENTIRNIKQEQAEKTATKEARKKLNEFKETIKTAPLTDLLDEKINQLPKTQQHKAIEEEKNTFSIGNTIRIKGSDTTGSIIEIQQNKAIIAIGQLKSVVKLSDIERISQKTLKKQQRHTTFVSKSTQEEIKNRKLNFKSEIDVRGMRAEEALQTVQYFIDDALIADISTVRILHGTGTGVLRDIIRRYLLTLPEIKKAKDEHIQLGGAGITVVEFHST